MPPAFASLYEIDDASGAPPVRRKLGRRMLHALLWSWFPLTASSSVQHAA